MTPALLSLLLLAAPKYAPPALPSLAAEVAAAKDERARVERASARLKGARYVLDPLGEGAAPDADPRLRLDAFDCQTYVETVLALAAAKAPAEVEPTLDDVRYDGAPAFVARHHFFEAQWVKANVAKGYVRDVTAALFPEDVVRHRKVVTEAQWDARPKKEQRLDLPRERAPIGAAEVDYLPLDKVLARAGAIPDGTIFVVVREDKPDVPHMVTHMGFLFHTQDGAVARHAGRDKFMRVVDEPLAKFVARNQGYRGWKVLGFMLLEPLERRAAKGE